MNDLDRLIDEACKQGFTPSWRGSGHLMMFPPARDSPIVTVSATPRSGSIARTRAQLIKAGLILPPAAPKPMRKNSRKAHKETEPG